MNNMHCLGGGGVNRLRSPCRIFGKPVTRWAHPQFETCLDLVLFSSRTGGLFMRNSSQRAANWSAPCANIWNHSSVLLCTVLVSTPGGLAYAIVRKCNTVCCSTPLPLWADHAALINFSLWVEVIYFPRHSGVYSPSIPKLLCIQLFHTHNFNAAHWHHVLPQHTVCHV